MFMSVQVLSIVSILAVSIVSLSGIALLTLGKNTLNKLMLLLIGFSTGAMFGDVFLHMLPEMTEDGLDSAQPWFILLGGIVASFVLEKFIHWHHCHGIDEHEEHDHEEHHHHHVGIMSIIGDMLHNGIDGVLIAGSYLVSVEVGIATTIAVVIHEIPQEIGDVGILLHSGYSRSKAILFNAYTGIASIAGGVIVLLMGARAPEIADLIVPFAAGNFLYVAGSDLIPELHKETAVSRSLVQFCGLITGIAFMAALTMLE